MQTIQNDRGALTLYRTIEKNSYTIKSSQNNH